MGIGIMHRFGDDPIRDAIAEACDADPCVVTYVVLADAARGKAPRLLTNSNTGMDEVTNLLAYFLVALKGPQGLADIESQLELREENAT
jgi:hypothetical protein